MRENEFLRFVYQNAPPHAGVAIGVGDDMAAVRLAGEGKPGSAEGPLALLKIDQCLDGVHMDLREHSAAQAGRKAVNRCLSDCAAMACMPAGVMVSVALPREGPGSGEAFARELFLACRDAAAAFDCPVVGGDTAIWDGRLVIVVSALGRMEPGVIPVTRSGARIGDALFVSGALGGSILGRHLTFTPRIALAQQLASAAGTGPAGALHAMMDLSDGLAADLPRLCAASGVGADIHTANLPVHDDAWRLSEKDRLPAALHALMDGEDYELLFAIDPEAVPKIVALSDIPLTVIGTVTAGPELRLIDASGAAHPWPKGGWEHRG
jgi:thiamine-monophosphate kinase